MNNNPTFINKHITILSSGFPAFSSGMLRASARRMCAIFLQRLCLEAGKLPWLVCMLKVLLAGVLLKI